MIPSLPWRYRARLCLILVGKAFQDVYQNFTTAWRARAAPVHKWRVKKTVCSVEFGSILLPSNVCRGVINYVHVKKFLRNKSKDVSNKREKRQFERYAERGCGLATSRKIHIGIGGAMDVEEGWKISSVMCAAGWGPYLPTWKTATRVVSLLGPLQSCRIRSFEWFFGLKISLLYSWGAEYGRSVRNILVPLNFEYLFKHVSLKDISNLSFLTLFSFKF